MAAPESVPNRPEPPVPPDDGGDDVFELPDVRRLPRPLLAAMVPWWATLVPATVALAGGQLRVALVLTASGMVCSAAAATAFLLVSARGQQE